MSLARYFVFKRGGEWLVCLDGTVLARHPSRPAAERSAIVMADLMGTMLHDADVMVEADGQLSITWIYGTDRLATVLEPAA
jgi:hypothetical protein